MTEYLRDKILELLGDEPIKSKELANKLNVHSGTIRTNCSILIERGVVIGLSGPKGGYIKIKIEDKNENNKRIN